jgi:hypothetical protein
MPRPTRRIIASGIAAWDADTDDNFNAITGEPFPMFQVVAPDEETDLPTASSYDQCFALVEDVMYISNGATWEVYQQAANVPDSTAATATDMATDFNTLLAVLIAADVMASS